MTAASTSRDCAPITSNTSRRPSPRCYATRLGNSGGLMKRSMLAALAAVAALWSAANAQEEKGAAPASSAPASSEVGTATQGDSFASGAPEAGAGGMPDAGAGNISGAHIPAAQ